MAALAAAALLAAGVLGVTIETLAARVGLAAQVEVAAGVDTGPGSAADGSDARRDDRGGNSSNGRGRDGADDRGGDDRGGDDRGRDDRGRDDRGRDDRGRDDRGGDDRGGDDRGGDDRGRDDRGGDDRGDRGESALERTPVSDSGSTASPPTDTAAGLPDAPAPPPAPTTGDGSAPHGSEDRSLIEQGRDQITKSTAYLLADAADGVGYDNAARHMRQYLGNSGDDLQVDPDAIMRDVPDFEAAVQQTIEFDLRDQIDAEISQNYDGEPISFQVTTGWQNHYLGEGDWFYALGGISYSVGAEVTITPGPDGTPIVSVQHQTHIYDRYNWDGGKSVNIGPVTIRDEQLGHLHEVGIAQEYEVSGTGDTGTFQYHYSPDGSTPTTPVDAGGDRSADERGSIVDDRTRNPDGSRRDGDRDAGEGGGG